MSFIFHNLSIPEVILIEPQLFPDNRGFFLENFKESVFSSNGITSHFIQDNFSSSTKDVLRGLHFQKNPMAQEKIVSVFEGEIFDVAVDIRQNSPTYGKWVSANLSASNHKSLYIPKGFAHGFCILSEQAQVFYKVSNEYSPDCDGGIMWNDPEIGIVWPIENPIISKKDSLLPSLKNSNSEFIY